MKNFSVIDLSSMPPLSQRGYAKAIHEIKLVSTPENDRFFELDGKGNIIPKGPGVVVPVFHLPVDHPARVYLAERKFSPIDLYQQFRLSYCEQEQEKIYYRKLAGGFKATPQGRIIFYLDVEGVTRGWQARVLELERGNSKWFFHPYAKRWMEVLRRDNDQSEWQPLEGFAEWEMPKYIIGPGGQRNKLLAGFDAAVNWNRQHRPSQLRVCVLVESCLDAARIGPPAVALLDKFMIDNRAELLAKAFRMIIFCTHNDGPGQALKTQVVKAIENHRCTRLLLVDLPGSVKGLKEMGRDEARDLVRTVFPVW